MDKNTMLAEFERVLPDAPFLTTYTQGARHTAGYAVITTGYNSGVTFGVATTVPVDATDDEVGVFAAEHGARVADHLDVKPTITTADITAAKEMLDKYRA